MASTEELQTTVQEQTKQIRTLKQALIRLEQKLQQVSVIARRSQENTRRNRERLQSLEHQIRQLIEHQRRVF